MRPLKLRNFLRIFRAYNIEIIKLKKTSHLSMSKITKGRKKVYTVAVDKNEIHGCYVAKARRRFRLTKKHGISDREFFSK